MSKYAMDWSKTGSASQAAAKEAAAAKKAKQTSNRPSDIVRAKKKARYDAQKKAQARQAETWREMSTREGRLAQKMKWQDADYREKVYQETGVRRNQMGRRITGKTTAEQDKRYYEGQYLPALQDETKRVNHLNSGSRAEVEQKKRDRDTRIGQWTKGDMGAQNRAINEHIDKHRKYHKDKEGNQHSYFDKEDMPMIQDLRQGMEQGRKDWFDYGSKYDPSQMMKDYGISLGSGGSGKSGSSGSVDYTNTQYGDLTFQHGDLRDDAAELLRIGLEPIQTESGFISRKDLINPNSMK